MWANVPRCWVSMIDTEMLLFVFQISPASLGQDSTTKGEIFSRDGLGRATWVKRITRNKTPANRRKSPSMPRWSIKNGFNFDKRNVDDISMVIKIPTAVDLETIFFFRDISPTTWHSQVCSQRRSGWEWHQIQGHSQRKQGQPWPSGWSWGGHPD